MTDCKLCNDTGIISHTPKSQRWGKWAKCICSSADDLSLLFQLDFNKAMDCFVSGNRPKKMLAL